MAFEDTDQQRQAWVWLPGKTEKAKRSFADKEANHSDQQI
tara:strand:- start:196 stop:315 length:120 start_codon:yes stop_codon:yes gene_type:complete